MIEKVLKEYAQKTDFIDVRVIEIKKEVISFEGTQFNNIFSDKKSFGVRILLNGGWGFAYSCDFNNVREVFDKAYRIAKLNANKKIKFNAPSFFDKKKYPIKLNPFEIPIEEKIEKVNTILKLLDADHIKNKAVLLNCSNIKRQVINPCLNVSQEFILTSLKLNITARQGDIIQSTYEGYSSLGGYENIERINLNEFTKKALDRINRLLRARPPKPTKTTVVCNPQMTGLFFHEAVGHACEADSVLNKSSLFSKTGIKVGSEEITLLDDPTFDENGFYWYDDEGARAKPTTLIENGVLKGFMHSLRTSNEMNVSPTGNGRCMDASYFPIPRMSNTVLKPGKWSEEDLISEVKEGYYVKGFKGGVVDTTTGQFSFGASECFEIKNGEIGENLRDVTLTGNILNCLKTIKVANNPQKTHLPGRCGKDGQLVRVGDCCPSILVKEVIVGGRHS